MADSHEASVSSLLRSRLRDLIFDWLDISDAGTRRSSGSTQPGSKSRKRFSITKPTSI